MYLKVNKENQFQVEATEKYDEASNFYIVRLDEDRYFSIVYEVSNVNDLDEPIKRRIEEECGKHKPGISVYLSASVNWRGRSHKNKPLQMQMSGKRFLTQMALQSRRSKHFQPAKLTEWTSGKEIFFIRCRKRTTLGPRRNDSYLCVQKHRQAKKPVKILDARSDKLDEDKEIPKGNATQSRHDQPEGKAIHSSQSKDDQPAQENNDQSKGKATQSSKSNDDKPEAEATQTSQGNSDQEKGKATQTSQGDNDQAEGKGTQTSQGNDEQAEGNPTQSSQNNDNQSDEDIIEEKECRRDDEVSHYVGCEPNINKHNDEDTFMLFRLLKSKRMQGAYFRDNCNNHCQLG